MFNNPINTKIMNTIKTLCILAIFSVTLTSAKAQEYEYDLSNAKKVVINNFLGEIKLKNHAENKLLIKSVGFSEVDEKAKGLKEIYGGGVDNTGIGLSVEKTENTVRISGATKRSEDAEYTFYFPENVSIKIDYSSPFVNGDIKVSGLANELEIETLNPGIELENVTGPLTLHAINGEIKVVFTSLSQKSPTSITTINGDLDITLPANTKADIEMSTIHGGLYTNHDIKYEKEKEKDGLSLIGGGDDIEGELNGGGVHLDLNSVNGSIYLRK
jgi:hypothetical protein